MTNKRDSGGRTLLDQLAKTYLRARWYVGAGLIALAALVFFTSIAGPESWVAAAAGGLILAHAFAMSVWNMEEATVALLVDLTATSLAAAIIAVTSGDHTPIVLTFVGGSILIGLFTERWTRVATLVYMAGLTLVALLVVEDWNLMAAVGDFIGGSFVAALVIGVISAIRSRIVELEAARAQTIGVVSHELRNHLTGIVGAIELIDGDGPQLTREEERELMGLAHQQSVEAGEVIEDLLIASRAERGVLDAMPEPIDLGPVTETVIRRTSLDTGDIVYDFTHGPVWAMADPLRYKQILRNLLTNALRYGGDTIRVSIEPYDGIVSVVVADNGEGIPDSDIPGLFIPYRTGKSGKVAAGSTGLGLWIAKNLAQKMDGELSYRRQSGQTVFELDLPAAEDPNAEPSSDETVGSPLSRSSR